MTLTRGDGKGMPPPASSYPPPFPLSLFLAHDARQDTELAHGPLLALKAKLFTVSRSQPSIRNALLDKAVRPWAHFHEASLVSALQIK